MASYIFYTDEGYTSSPNNEEIENLQVLGIEDGNSQRKALDNLLKNNEWIKESGFSEEKIRCYTIIKPKIIDSIKQVLDYMWKDEERHWEESEYPNEHIFNTLKEIKESI